MKKQWKTAFYFTKSERNGIITLAFCCVLLLVVPILFRYWQTPREVDFSAFEQMTGDDTAIATRPQPVSVLFHFNPNTLSADSFLLLGLDKRTAGAIVNYRNKGGRFFKSGDFARIYTLKAEDFRRLEPYIQIPEKRKGAHQADKPQAQLSWFDPNDVSFDQLLSLGVPAKTAGTWMNFIKKGGTFQKPEDLQKIYGLSSWHYKRLAPWVFIKKTKAFQPTASFTSHVPPPTKASARIDINRATQSDWEQLDGIGPAYARKINGFRDKLGGFASIDQIAETRGLPDSVFQRIRPHLDWSPVFQQLDINAADEETLNAHPYLNFREAKAIVSYRTQHGPFTSAEDLKKLHALSPETLRKILPYLKF